MEKHNLIIKGIEKSWNDEDLNRYIDELMQEARKELIKDEIKWLNSFDWNITKDAVNNAVEQIQKTYSELDIEHFAFIVQDQENKIKKINDRIKQLQEIKEVKEK